MGLMFAPLRRYVDFSGRSRRLEYWLWAIFVFVGLIVAMVLDAKLGLGGTMTSSSEVGDGTASASFNVSGGGYITMAFALLVIIPGLALSIRRMHDQNRSGWWILVPLVGAIMIMFIGGTAGPNRFGPDPKGGAGAPDAQAFT
jgi:uncharacterized membrane protein YhaH (DUF805 family)